ncbi:MAG TPA: hypothetical protein VFA41_00465 [Ktedonobacteraceae bacterium]|nr:hypothetical protein [Ktedonobacteraceae bacterium]
MREGGRDESRPYNPKMPLLHVLKAMTTNNYQEILHEIIQKINQLSIDEQEQLLEALTLIIRGRSADSEEPWHSLLELEGLGSEIWQGIDLRKYIEEERNSWD